jgi:hypothetical protein
MARSQAGLAKDDWLGTSILDDICSLERSGQSTIEIARIGSSRNSSEPTLSDAILQLKNVYQAFVEKSKLPRTATFLSKVRGAKGVPVSPAAEVEAVQKSLESLKELLQARKSHQACLWQKLNTATFKISRRRHGHNLRRRTMQELVSECASVKH